MLTVSHRIQIASDIWSSTEHSRLLALHSSASMTVPVNECRVTMTHPQGLSASPGDEMTVKLGYGSSLNLVFTGEIASVDWQIDRVTILAQSAFRRLAVARLNYYFEQSKAGDIVSNVCGELDVKKGDVSNGLEFAYYALGDHLTVYAHLGQLAESSGFDLYADERDKLNFSKNLALQSLDFQFGVNILALSVDAPQPLLEGIEIYGESPASLGQGSTASTWLTKKEIKGSAGSTGGIVKRISDPAIRALQDATQAAQSILDARLNKKKGLLKTLGNSAVKLGLFAKVSKMPLGEQNGSYKITGVEHRIGSRNGWVTSLFLEEKSGGLPF